MKNKFHVFAVIIIALLTVTGCAKDSDSDSEQISLSYGWSYALSETAVESGQFSSLKATSLSNLETIVPKGKGYIWLKKNFVIPKSLKGQDLGIYLGRIALADQTFVNGTYVGGEGYFPPNEFSAWNTARFYTLPSNILKEFDNTLLIKIWVDGEGSIVSNPFIGTVEEAKLAASREGFWNSRIHLIFAFLMVIIGGYHLMMFFKNHKDKENLMFALINILSSLYLSVFYYSELPGFSGAHLSFLWFQKIFSNALPFLFPVIITSFILSFLNMKEKRKLLHTRLFLALIPIIIVLCAPDYQILRSMRWTQLFLIPPMLYFIYLIIRAMIAKNRDAIVLLIGFSPMVATVLADLIIHNIFKLYYFPYITSIGWQLVIVTLLFIMANRFVNSRKQAEYLNKNLEKEVEERTAELSSSNQKLSSVNEKLELINTQLSEAKEKADKDMKLAAYVQKSFYSSLLPTFKEWDIAYAFHPAAGVSGDLYDFFYNSKTLEGVGLFDVSGHGIGSGLVTMLAKNVIEHNFTEGLNKPFSTVMENINTQIAEEKGDIENYLTGVMLRIQKEKLEFINAGHPKVFLRTGKNGTVYPVELKDKDAGGSTIGFAGLNPKYVTVKFAVHKGDSIILYTAGLNNSKNKDGEQFGEERIAQIFAESGSGSAKDRLDYVLASHKKFTQGTEQTDDLTVIVLQYNGE